MYCGTDIIEVDRIKEAINSNDKFIYKIYSENEIKIIKNIVSDVKYQRYAGRFAAKEAIFKAVSKIVKDNKLNLEFKDIEILNDKNNRPYVNFLNKDVKLLLKKYYIDVSISHVKEYATSICIISKSI